MIPMRILLKNSRSNKEIGVTYYEGMRLATPTTFSNYPAVLTDPTSCAISLGREGREPA